MFVEEKLEVLEEDAKVENNQAVVTTSKISATSSLTINLGNYNSARIEMTIEKTINRPDLVNMEEVKEDLWNEVNSEVDKQIADIRNSLKK